MKKLMSWLSIVVISIFIVANFSIVDCKAKEAIQLNILVGAHPSVTAMRETIPAFEELFNAKVILDEMDAMRVYDKALIETASSVSSYDVIMLDVVWIAEFAKKGLIEEINRYLYDENIADPEFDYDDIVPSYREALCEWGGKIYALPISGEANMLAYRKDLFEKYDKNPPKTMEELMELAEFFNGKEENLYGISMLAQRGHMVTYGWFCLLWPFNGPVLDENMEPRLNTPEAVESLKFFAELVNNFSPLGAVNAAYEEATMAFQQGMAALYIAATNISYLENPEYSIVGGNIGYSLIPAKKTQAHAVAGWTLAIPANAKNKEMSYKFIEFVNNKESDKTKAIAGTMPNRVSTFEDPDLISEFPYYPFVLEALKKGEAEFRPRIPEWQQMSEIIGLYIHQAILGEKTAQEALDIVQKEVREVLEDAGYYKN